MANRKRVVIEVARRGAAGGLTLQHVQDVVPPLVDQRLAQDDAPAQAAAAAAEAAVDAEIVGRDLLEGGDILEDDIAGAVVDDNNRTTWAIWMKDGSLHPYTEKVFAQSFTQLEEMNTDVTGLLFALTVKESENAPEVRTELEFGEDGRFTDRVVASISKRLGLGGTATTTAIACHGDSLTLGSGATTSDAAYPSVLASLAGVAVSNRGVGGDSSSGIAARQGGQPFVVAVSDGIIPASGSVAVTVSTATGGGFAFTNGPAIHGELIGIPGLISRSGSGPYTYAFTRDTAGDAVLVTKPERFWTTQGREDRAKVTLIWAGNNNPTNTDRVLNDIATMVEYLAGSKVLILGLIYNNTSGPGSPNQTGALAINDALRDRYGGKFFDTRDYLVNYALSDAGITPTDTDTANIADNIVPASLRVDSIHLNDTGYNLVARQVYRRLTELEYI